MGYVSDQVPERVGKNDHLNEGRNVPPHSKEVGGDQGSGAGRGQKSGGGGQRKNVRKNK